ncbi:transcription factor Ouib-like [Teleopsis dalmanni]|uniref:transcription factor Ouib-like n=1 Tax=Teleopsis dalmanni TaxID=139649 RepID=UPI0018CD4B75|nr:transcription factor Ouib-like [Teleopsis dalmanni]
MDLNWCRLCVNVVNSSIAQNLFENRETMREVQSLLGIELRNDVGLPPYICENCETNLEIAYKFQMRCLRAQNYFSSNKFQERLSAQYDYFYKNEKINNISQTMVDQKNEEVSDDDFTEDISSKTVSFDFNDIIEESLENSNINVESVSDESAVQTKPIFMLDKKPTLHKKSNPKNTTNRTWVCEFCGRIFTAHNHYHYHIRRHKGIKKHACKYCPKKFVGSNELKIHERVHTGERPYSCVYCERKFTCAYQRNQHVGRMHTNNRPYKCEFCTKGFTNNKCLKQHLLIHNKDRIHSCNLCNKTFAYECNYHTHCKSQTHKAREKMMKSIKDD